MRLSHCESLFAGPFRYVPCLPESKDASGGDDSAAAAARPASGVAAATEEQPPPVQKIEVAVADDAEEEEEEEKREGGATPAVATAAAPVTKSILKKPGCGDSKCAAKGNNVQWLDQLGKDLTEVKEFKPSESGDWLDDGYGMEGLAASVCVIQ